MFCPIRVKPSSMFSIPAPIPVAFNKPTFLATLDPTASPNNFLNLLPPTDFEYF